MPESTTSSAANNSQLTTQNEQREQPKRTSNVRRPPRGATSTTRAPSFKGDVPAMQGRTFITHCERGKSSRFKETLDALRILASTEYKKDIAYLGPLFKSLESPVVNPPIRPTAGPDSIQSDGTTVLGEISDVDMDIYREEMKIYVTRKDRLEALTTSLYNIAWGQCSHIMRDKLRATSSFSTIEEAADAASLLKEIRGICHQIEPTSCIYDSIDELQRQFFAYRQQPGMDNITHLGRFRDFVEVMNHFGIKMFRDECCIAYEKQYDKDQRLSALEPDKGYLVRIEQRRLAVCFLRRSNMQIYTPLMRELRDQFLHGMDIYPRTLDEAFSLLQHHSSGKRKPPRPNMTSNDAVSGMQYAQRGSPSRLITPDASDDEAVPGANGQMNPSVTCWSYRRHGHYGDNFPTHIDKKQPIIRHQHFIDGAVLEELSDGDSSSSSIEFAYGFTQRELAKQDTKSILLDTGSNYSVFNNPSLLQNIRTSETVLRAFTNGGFQDSFEVGYFPGFFDV